jgi:hypothetical protein
MWIALMKLTIGKGSAARNAKLSSDSFIADEYNNASEATSNKKKIIDEHEDNNNE